MSNQRQYNLDEEQLAEILGDEQAARAMIGEFAKEQRELSVAVLLLNDQYREHATQLKATAELLGVGQEQVLRAAARAGSNYNLAWYQVLPYIRSFHTTLKNLQATKS